MRIAVFGAGAVGGYVGAKLAEGGVDVTLIARGASYEALRTRGLTLLEAERTTTVRPRTVSNPTEAGPQDYVFVAVKAHALPAAAKAIAALLHEDTAVVFAVNGVPYWYHHATRGPHAGCRVESVDPAGALSRVLPPSRAIGCIVYPALHVPEPGIVRHLHGERFSLGEPSGERTERVTRLARALGETGLTAKVTTRIREELWIKLWGNLAFNPVSLLTHATLDRVVGDAETYALCRAMMVEGRAVAEALGVRFAMTVERRLQGAREVGAHRTSMLQDLEQGRPIELDAILGAVIELAELTHTEVPMCRAVLALARQRARLAGCYPDASTEASPTRRA